MMRRVAGIVAAAFLAAAPAAAQPAVTREVTPGGISFRHVLVPNQPLQSLHFAWPDPAATKPDKAALSVLGPVLIMEGARGWSRSELIEELQDLQASLSLFGDGWRLRGAIGAPAKTFAAAAAAMKRVLAEPALPAAKLDLERRNAEAAWRQASENPDALARRLLSRLLRGDDPRTRALDRDPESLAAVSHDDIVRWTRAALVRSGLEIVAAGALPVADAAAAIDDLFGWMPAGAEPPPPPRQLLRGGGRLIVLERPVVQTIIAMGGATTLPVDEHLVRADMLASVLGGGFQSRLYRSVRERLGAAYGVSTGLTPIDPRGFGFAIRAAVANEKGREALAAIREDYARFLAEGPTADEIDPLRARLVANRNEGLRRPGGVASLVMNGVLAGLPDDAMATYAARLAGYPLSDFTAVLGHFPQPPLTAVVIAPSADGWGADCVIKSMDEIDRCR